MALILLVKVQSQVFAVKYSGLQVGISNGKVDITGKEPLPQAILHGSLPVTMKVLNSYEKYSFSDYGLFGNNLLSNIDIGIVGNLYIRGSFIKGVVCTFRNTNLNFFSICSSYNIVAAGSTGIRA